MQYLFEGFELDLARVELRAGGAAVAVEPQVFALLVLLVENRDRMVPKDEIVERIWGGRIISDAAIASRIKSARQAIGDDGRFLGEVAVDRAPCSEPQPKSAAAEQAKTSPDIRPRIAVLPFRLLGDAGAHYVIAEALPQDLITALSRLRWLFVIARASSFRFSAADQDLAAVRQALGVRYCVTGLIEVFGSSMSVFVELSDAQEGRVIWGERFRAPLAGAHEVREEIVQRVIDAIEFQIPINEARRAQLKAPDSLDAWSAYHLGLQRMYRFTKPDNESAASYFSLAASQDPDFARAYAGLSFTHFQNAFLRYSDDPAQAAALARRSAEQCLERDPADPSGALALGRAHWLTGDLEAGLPWLERASALNPNYAQARYSRAWTLAMLGQSDQSRSDVDAALELSPLDPLRYGMLGVRAFTHLSEEDHVAAAGWAEQAALAPGAHALIEMIAVVAHALAGDGARAAHWARSAHARAPDFTAQDFLRVFPCGDPRLRIAVNRALLRHGF